MADPKTEPKCTPDRMSLGQYFDMVSRRLGWAAFLTAFIVGLIWATASGKDYPLIAVVPLVTILAARLVGQKLGGFVGLVAKYAAGLLVASLLVTVLLFYSRLHEWPRELQNVVPKDIPAWLINFLEGESGHALMMALTAIYMTDSWTSALLVGFIGAAACEIGLTLLAVVTLCVRRALRISRPGVHRREPTRWYQLSLRTALLLLLIFSVGMGWFATRSNRARENRNRVSHVEEAVKAIEKLGGDVTMSRDDEREPTWLEKLFDDPGGPDGPTVAIKVQRVTLKNLDALELASELDDLKLLVIQESNLADTHLRQIGNMTGLETLYLIDVHVAHLSAISSLKKLELWNVHVEGPGPEHLTGLENLSELVIGETTGFFEHVSHMPALRKIKLFHSDVGNTMKRLHRWTTLKEVDLSGSDVTDDDLRHLRAVPALEVLLLNYTAISDAGLVTVSGLTKLVELNLWGTKITDRGLEKLQELDQLSSLDLTATDIGDAGLERLRSLTQLAVLNLGATQITSTGLKFLVNMSDLVSLDVSQTKVDDSGLKHLMKLTDLWILRMYETAVTDEGEAKLQDALPYCTIYR